MKSFVLLLLIGLVVVDEHPARVHGVEHGSILEYLNDLPRFSSLVHLLIKAGLTSEMIAGDYKTLLAPTNDAWQKEGSLADLEKDPDHLRHLLLFHVAGVPLVSPVIRDGMTAPSLGGGNLKFNRVNNSLYVENQALFATDVIVGNGIVQELDTVLTLPRTDVMGYLLLNPHAFSQLLTAFLHTGFQHTLTAGIHTVLAPTDAAFSAVWDRIPTDSAALSALLMNHIIDGAVFTRSLQSHNLRTLSGKVLDITTNAFGFVHVNDSTIIQKDVNLVNGVIHVIDEVLF